MNKPTIIIVVQATSNTSCHLARIGRAVRVTTGPALLALVEAFLPRSVRVIGALSEGAARLVAS